MRGRRSPDCLLNNKGYPTSFRSSRRGYCQLTRRRSSSAWHFRLSIWHPSLWHATQWFSYTMKKRAKLRTDDIDLPLESWDALCDFAAVGSVMHQEQLNVGLISDQQLLQTAGKKVSRSPRLPASDRWHANASSKLTPDDTINTSWLSPGSLQKHKQVSVFFIMIGSISIALPLCPLRVGIKVVRKSYLLRLSFSCRTGSGLSASFFSW